ncbi:tetratricopeptide repeat protein [Nitratifractor sp.]
MSRNPVIHALWAVLLTMGVAGKPVMQKLPGEDSLIVRALLAEERGDYPKSEALLLTLYDKTGKVEYLLHAARETMVQGTLYAEVVDRLEAWLRKHRKKHKDLRPSRVLAALYARDGEPDRALKIARNWLSRSEDPEDLKLLASLLISKRRYTEASKLLEKAYEKSKDPELLLRNVALMEKYLGRRQQAIRLLETHLRMNRESPLGLYFGLIELYAKEKRFDKVLEIYKKLYERDPREVVLKKIVQLSLYLKDFDGLEKFLAAHPGNEELLYLLYKRSGRFDKAIALAQRRYEETRRPKWLAEEAILTYEGPKKEKKLTPEVLKRFRELFDRALKEGADDSLYLNYYGYTLIDHDLDIDRGIALVRKALEQQPDNAYYLDSLAWGLYKKGECTQAYKVMKRVFDGGAPEEPEIRDHYRAIEACMKRQSNNQEGK